MEDEAIQVIFTDKSQKMRRTIGAIGIGSLLIVLPAMTYAEAPTQTTLTDINKVVSEGQNMRDLEGCAPKKAVQQQRHIPYDSRMGRLITRRAFASEEEQSENLSDVSN